MLSRRRKALIITKLVLSGIAIIMKLAYSLASIYLWVNVYLLISSIRLYFTLLLKGLPAGLAWYLSNEYRRRAMSGLSITKLAKIMTGTLRLRH